MNKLLVFVYFVRVLFMLPCFTFTAQLVAAGVCPSKTLLVLTSAIGHLCHNALCCHTPYRYTWCLWGSLCPFAVLGVTVWSFGDIVLCFLTRLLLANHLRCLLFLLVTREETGDHPGDHKLLTCKDAPADIQVSHTLPFSTVVTYYFVNTVVRYYCRNSSISGT